MDQKAKAFLGNRASGLAQIPREISTTNLCSHFLFFWPTLNKAPGQMGFLSYQDFKYLPGASQAGFYKYFKYFPSCSSAKM